MPTGVDNVNHNSSLHIHSNRQASRRLHRRPASTAPLPCALGLALNVRAGATAPAFPQASIRRESDFDLLVAELRIAELERALEEAREAACIDPLTGALNRRGFDKACQREMARARRSKVKFALVHLDLDDFKHLNDTLGHLAGDQALVHLVRVLHQSMRPADVLCRVGGEEFVLILPDTALEAAAAAVSRFLAEFSAQAVPGIDYGMTFSAGVVLPELNESIDQALARADAATYDAKRAGKNRVVTR